MTAPYSIFKVTNCVYGLSMSCVWEAAEATTYEQVSRYFEYVALSQLPFTLVDETLMKARVF